MEGADELRKMLFNNFSPFSMMQPVQQQGAPVNPLAELKRKKSLENIVANLRFLRTFNVETGAASDWIINGLSIGTRKLEL